MGIGEELFAFFNVGMCFHVIFAGPREDFVALLIFGFLIFLVIFLYMQVYGFGFFIHVYLAIIGTSTIRILS